MFALAILAKSPIVDEISATAFTSIGAKFKELGVLLDRGEVGAKAPARGTSAATVQNREMIVMLFCCEGFLYSAKSHCHAPHSQYEDFHQNPRFTRRTYQTDESTHGSFLNISACNAKNLHFNQEISNFMIMCDSKNRE